MDFFARQDLARKRTKLLVFYFTIAVILIVAMVYAVVMVGVNFSLQQRQHRQGGYQSPPLVLWHPQAFAGAGLGTLLVILIGSAWKTSQLSGGGGSVATMMGGRPVNPDSADPDERKLLNIVEEMSIASGVPMPEVYVLDHEEGINAFAAGHSTNDAAIGVTRGCIRLLSRDELQGVIGHEFSHVLNGDMRLNLRLVGIIFGILCLATIGRILLRVRGSGSNKGKNPLPLLGLALLIIGGMGVFFGRLIQAAVSRQREFLADASAVQFTRNPSGLSGALQKIGRHSFGSKLESDHAPDMCHMFFGNGLGSPLVSLMATHPPIPDRIRAIDPAWDGTFPALKPEQFETVKRAALRELKPSPMPEIMRKVGVGLAGLEGERTVHPAPPVQAQTVAASVGNVSPLQLQYAEAMREALPESLKAAARQPQDATALIYALLLATDDAFRAGQLAGIASRVSPAVADKTVGLFPEVSVMARSARLPLVNLALGALRNLSLEEFDVFSDTLAWLVESDEQVDLFEFVLQKIVRHHLGARFGGNRLMAVQYYTLKPLVPDCVVLLSALAHVGSGDDAQIQRAFAAGAPFLRAPAGVAMVLLPREQCSVDVLDAALNRLALAAPIIKKNLIEAAARVVGADGLIQEAEAELLRAMAETLDCPLPPLGVRIAGD